MAVAMGTNPSGLAIRSGRTCLEQPEKLDVYTAVPAWPCCLPWPKPTGRLSSFPVTTWLADLPMFFTEENCRVIQVPERAQGPTSWAMEMRLQFHLHWQPQTITQHRFLIKWTKSQVSNQLFWAIYWKFNLFLITRAEQAVLGRLLKHRTQSLRQQHKGKCQSSNHLNEGELVLYGWGLSLQQNRVMDQPDIHFSSFKN